jgi:hypothetical protein
MRTLKFVFNMRVNSDCNISIQTEHLVADPSEAHDVGREARRLSDEFLAGYIAEGENQESK